MASTLDSFEALDNEIITPANVFNVVYPNSHFIDEGIDFQTVNTNDVEEFDCTLWNDGDVNLLPHLLLLQVSPLKFQMMQDTFFS